MQTVQLDKSKHDRHHFDCGIDALNNYLRIMASQQAKKDNTRTFVLEDAKCTEHIIGYYTLTMTPIDLTSLPIKLQKKHQNVSSGGLIARLAVDQRYKGNGYGEWLLIDALKKLLMACEAVAFPIVIVDAKDGVECFYKKYGFTAFQDTENKLFITISDLRASIGS
ncbi:GNAT family N-acetyltransferase [Pelagibaculum spongiae]|uniref:GNAT family N-acetyltransferase n=2 Tax=Pelagibaculum spongiae TaxID=2080658 RepID=A0A2V1GR46_9GAMM|nr:GNAT family N-acetyltransferase [Pelagibaculum spongiae]